MHIVRRLRVELPDLQLTIAGATGAESPELLCEAQTAAHEGTSWLTVLCDPSDEDLNIVYGSADVFVLLSEDRPGEFEGFGIAFIEASRHGLPVVAGRSGGSVEAVLDGFTGYIVDSDDQVEVAIRSLESDRSLRLSMGESGRRHAEKFRSERIARDFAEMYSDVLSRRRAGL